MNSDDKDKNELELEGVDKPNEDEVIDVEVADSGSAPDTMDEDDVSPVESLAASSLSGDYEDDFDVEITGDENIDFGDDDDEPMVAAQGGDKFKKILAPALVLVIAVGVGGYIVMNPQILGGGSAVPAPENPYVAQAPASSAEDNNFFSSEPEPVVEQAANDITEPSFGADLPQPTVNQNETPRPPSGDLSELADFDEPVAVDADPIEVADVDLPEGFEDLPQGSAPDMPDLDFAAATEEAEPVVPVIETEPALAEESSALEDELAMLETSAEADVTEVPAESAPVPAPEALTPIAEDAAPFEIAQADISEVEDPVPPSMPLATQETRSPNVAVEDSSRGEISSPVEPSTTIAPASNTYYDGTVPKGPLADVGPRKVDPEREPASQLVVVKKSHDKVDMEAMLVSGNRALKLKRYESALDIFQQLYDKNPRDQRILMGLAVAQQNTGRDESAIRTYEALLDRDPNNANAMLNMLGIIRSQYPSVALRRLIGLHEKYPDNAGIAAQVGVTHADLGHSDDAMRFLGIATSLEPTNAQHYFNMAVIADRSGSTKQAITYYEKALELDAVYSSGRSISRETVYDRLAVLRKR